MQKQYASHTKRTGERSWNRNHNRRRLFLQKPAEAAASFFAFLDQLYAIQID